VSAFKAPDDLVFCTRDGRGKDYRRVGEVFREAVRRSGVRGAARLALHSLRHGLRLAPDRLQRQPAVREPAVSSATRYGNGMITICRSVKFAEPPPEVRYCAVKVVLPAVNSVNL
jgi:hypothetical protein